MTRFARPIVSFAVACLVTCAAYAADAPKTQAASSKELARGKYIVQIGGCNDCHTPGYAMSGGKVPEKDWLVGDQLGWRGAWGTTYPVNLRLYMQKLTEAQWLKTAKSIETRPPMPWFALHAMTDADLRALYRFVRHLGPAGAEAPAYVPPDKEPKPPYVQFPGPPPK
jgi:mono/diheme cytochrome c family protein